jgi:hypothetical protein
LHSSFTLLVSPSMMQPMDSESEFACEKTQGIATQEVLSCSTTDASSDGALSEIADNSQADEVTIDAVSEKTVRYSFVEQADDVTVNVVCEEIDRDDSLCTGLLASVGREDEPSLDSAVKEQIKSDGRLAWTMEDTFLRCNGYIPAGSDVLVARMSIAKAMAKCRQLPECQGFTFKGQCYHEEPVVHFKSRWELQSSTVESWTSYRYVKARSQEAQLPADLLIHGALQPASFVDFRQITEICERLEGQPQEISSTVSALVGVLGAPGNFRAKLKALTIINEMLYNTRIVDALGEEGSFVGIMKTLQDARETGLGAEMDANMRMLATEINRQIAQPRQNPNTSGLTSNSLRQNAIKASRLASQEIEKTTSQMKFIARGVAKTKPESLQVALFEVLKISTNMMSVSTMNAKSKSHKSPNRRFPCAVATGVDEANSDRCVERRRQVPAMNLSVTWERQGRVFL